MLLIVCGVQVRRTDYMNYHITLFCVVLRHTVVNANFLSQYYREHSLRNGLYVSQ